MSSKWKFVLSALCVAILVAPLANAIAPESPEGDNEKKHGWGHREEALDVHPSLTRVLGNRMEVDKRPGLRKFVEENGTEWEFFVDERNDRPNLVHGKGIPFVPGNGNKIGRLKHGGPAKMADLEGKARGFMRNHSNLFDVADEDLVLIEKGSGNFGSHGQLWFVEMQQTYEGIPVEGAKVFFRVNNGNLIAFGSERAARIRGLNTRPNLDEAEAFDKVLDRLGVTLDDVDEIQTVGDLKILPTLLPGERRGQTYKGTRGRGYKHQLAREFKFTLKDDPASYEAFVNARNGKVLQMLDGNLQVDVRGGVLPETTTDTEVVLDFNNVATSGSCTSLDGTYTRINDNCGSINICDADDGATDNVINMGTNSGDDCSTPGYGGAGNTKSARSGHYHLSQINRTADIYHPTNSWIDSKLTANMNINNTCNAYWTSGAGTVNFYRSGGGCGNTGEIAAVFLHEWGHGFDHNTGGSANENGSGEAVGDTFAMIYLQDSCIGDGFDQTNNCYNCDNCTGVRDPEEFSLTGNHTIASPANVTANAGINCDRWSCPYTTPTGFPYRGPMGYEGHCESYIASSAIWDLKDQVGWTTLEQLWYDSLVPSKSAYQVASGGQCNPSATVNGCASTNWYQVFLEADDDDGNLANGTPNACLIWDSFNAHGIACGARPNCSVACTPPAAPTGLTATANGQNQVDLTWGSVSGATYNVYRGGGACGSGQTLIASGVAGTSYSDTSASAGTEYNYTVAAVASSCTSAKSTCDSATTDAPPAGSCPAGQNKWEGTITTGGADQVTPDCSASGTFSATLTCNSSPSADLDLFLDEYVSSWWSSSWTAVDQSGAATCNEAVSNYSGASGTYRWRINAYSGSTTYTLCTNQC